MALLMPAYPLTLQLAGGQKGPCLAQARDDQSGFDQDRLQHGREPASRGSRPSLYSAIPHQGHHGNMSH